ncbi:acyl carrier protein [Alloyangia pacifica]|uniref:Acyl carrier protein n=1 Tax=Alloyangia pacifica TaxID=311180 RepID=A0A1I6VGA6_9RHOB|nr:phosphopantetheine-binding protein [Alloyangia pacifica]SDH96453.1 acyl carrier protein [Alloyangia pacifica]SFT12687.1 acyl carrier protein [Alloyangia pacifica]
MTETDMRRAFIDALVGVAPDIDPGSLGEDEHIQRDLGLDSMDVLNLVASLHDRLGIDIPEADYPQIATLALAVPYLQAAGASGQG